jgi:ribonuclease P protein component
VRARLLDVRSMESSAGHPRVAILVPKHGFTAVRRNRLKRQLREIARHELLPRELSRDVLLRARRETYAASFPDLVADVNRAAAAMVPRPQP